MDGDGRGAMEDEVREVEEIDRVRDMRGLYEERGNVGEGSVDFVRFYSDFNHWTPVSFGDVVKINPRRQLKKGLFAPHVAMEDLPTNARQIQNLRKKKYQGSGSRFKNGDTLFARITPCLENGKTAFVDVFEEGIVAHGSTEFIVFSAIKGVTDSRFIYYLARSPEFRDFAIQRMEGTSGRQRVPAPALAKYQFQLPPLKEQQAIAQILSTLDDKIELNRRMNQTLEATAQAIFKSWFVDFDPVRAKAEGRQPEGMDAETAELFPDGFDDDGKPVGWQRRSIGSLGKVVTGKTPPTKQSSNFDGVYPFITIPDLDGRVFINNSARTLSEQGMQVVKGSLIPKNAVMMSCIATVGRCGITMRESVTNQQINSVICGADIDPRYLYWSFRSLGKDLKRIGGGGSIYTNVSKSRFSSIEVIIPPIESQKAFSKFWFDRLKANGEESLILAQLRDTLLPKLLSGELHIVQAEKQLEEAA